MGWSAFVFEELPRTGNLPHLAHGGASPTEDAESMRGEASIDAMPGIPPPGEYIPSAH